MTNAGNKVMPAMQSPREEVKRTPNGITLTPVQLADILFWRPSHLFDISSANADNTTSKPLVNAFICTLDNINQRSSQIDESSLSFVNYVTSRTNRLLRPIDVLLPNFLMNPHVAVAMQNASIDTTVVQKEFYKMHSKRGLQNLWKTIRTHGNDFLLETAQKKSCVYGRKFEIEQLTKTLCMANKKISVILVGEPGVGRTSIVEGFAQRLLQGRLVCDLLDKSIMVVDTKAVFSGAKDQSVFNKRMMTILNEAESSNGKIILFIKDIHLIFHDGSNEAGRKNVGAMLMSMINEQKVQCIATTTPEEYNKLFEEGNNSEKKYEKVAVAEPSLEEALAMLKESKERYESLYSVRILDEALEAAIKLSDRHMTDRHLPEKVFSLVDEACSKVTEGKYKDRNSKDILRTKSMSLREEKPRTELKKTHRRSTSLFHCVSCFLKEIIGGQGCNMHIPKPEERLGVDLTGRPTVGPEHIIEVVTSLTGLPTNKLGLARSVNLANRLNERVIGQFHVADILEQTISLSSVDFSFRKKPLSSFLFVGGNGVGKTEIAKVLAKELFGDDKALVSVDMSVYQTEQSVLQLMADAIGFDEGSSDLARRKLDMVVVLERIEMAPHAFITELHQLLQTGTIKDDQGRILDFTNTIFIVTSNLGSKYFHDVPVDSSSWTQSQGLITQEVKEHLSNAFVSLLDEIVIFNPLSTEHLKQIFSLQIANLQSRLHQDGIELNVTDTALHVMSKKAYIPGCGARPIRRWIEKNVVTRLVEIMVAAEEDEAITIVTIDAADEVNELNYNVSKSRKSMTLDS
ncbi:Chaperone protein ClpB [Rhynchospora pubera]|uniref:Chaperone protein ClpB n=1 Tax=Rhynchospora pubera TaxID=906938 RepID=A0AAV8C2L7_9POAL|nr:Chaperone protein ClpB [Rhynchospora pubera]